MSRLPVVRMTPLVMAVGLLTVAGCGGSKSNSSPESSAPAAPASAPTTSPQATPPPAGGGNGASALSLSANSEGQLAYDTKSLSAKAGKVTIDFSNGSPLAHNVTVESSSGSTVGSTPTFQGGSKTLSLSLKPGTYKFFCSVPGHRQAGMEGTLVVK